MSLINIRNFIHKVSATKLRKCELNNNETHEPAKLDGGKPGSLIPTQRTTGDQGKLGVREVVIPREEYTRLISGAKRSALKHTWR